MPAAEIPKEQVVPVLMVDTSGRFCPGPVIEASNAVHKVGLGETFELFTTDKGTWRDIPAWCRNTGNTLLVADDTSSTEKEDGERRYRFVVRRDR